MSLLISGVRLADGTVTDVAVHDGLIVPVSDLPADAERVDGDGLLALPGLVDLHTHLREPGREDAETVATGTAAAARGGYTAVFAMANLDPVTDTAEAASFARRLCRSRCKSTTLPRLSSTCGCTGDDGACASSMSSICVSCSSRSLLRP